MLVKTIFLEITSNGNEYVRFEMNLHLLYLSKLTSLKKAETTIHGIVFSNYFSQKKNYGMQFLRAKYLLDKIHMNIYRAHAQICIHFFKM